MLYYIAKWEEGNHVRDVLRFYLRLYSGLDRRLSYKVSYLCCYIRGCQRRKSCKHKGCYEHRLVNSVRSDGGMYFAEQV